MNLHAITVHKEEVLYILLGLLFKLRSLNAISVPSEAVGSPYNVPCPEVLSH